MMEQFGVFGQEQKSELNILNLYMAYLIDAVSPTRQSDTRS